MTEPLVRHYGPRAYADHPPFRYPDYKSTIQRSPTHDLVRIVATLTETTGPGPVWSEIADEDADLTTNAGTGGEAIGERIIVYGQVLDENGRGVPGTILEIWQANASGRYAHWRETAFPAPLDPNFIGVGQCLTNERGEYRFTTIKPGPYPWGNHPNAWRPAHIHFSVLGPALGSRLVTQMYFEGDPLLPLDPIFNSAPEHSRHRMISHYDHDITIENWALGYRFDIVLRGELSALEEETEE
ncbi:MAG TPA: protocatechuate 3,4-dioxygenase subunit beta [Acidimicrobiia bacterium]|nr:protocatechuate 3,4-dioxygenase subunit beta [Acidimicrobiia bacterium]